MEYRIRKRQIVSYSQLKGIYELLNKQRDIAVHYSKSSECREIARKFWEDVARRLNAYGGGAVKEWKGWCKFWADYKCRLKAKAISMKSQNSSGEGQSRIRKFTNIETKFLDILGYDASPNPELPVEENQLEQDLSNQIKINISSESEANSESYKSDGSDSSLSASPSPSPPQDPLTPRPQPPRIIIRRGTSARSSHDNHTPVPSAPVRVRRPPSRREVTSPPAAQFATKAERCRPSRRELPMTVIRARRALVVETQKQTRIQERELQLFEKLVKELSEIKEIIRERY